MTPAEVYARLPTVHCQGLCGASACREVVPVSEVEMPGLLELALGGVLPESNLPGPCPFLTREGRCSVYARRPMICRLHGAVPAELSAITGKPSWRCPHGCRVDGEISAVDLARLMDEAGMWRGPRRSTSATLNRLLEQLGATAWYFEGEDLVVETPDP